VVENFIFTLPPRASACHRSSPVSRSSSPLLVNSVLSETPLDVAVGLPLVLHLEPAFSGPYCGSWHRPPPLSGELPPLRCSLPVAWSRSYLMSTSLLCSLGTKPKWSSPSSCDLSTSTPSLPAALKTSPVRTLVPARSSRFVVEVCSWLGVDHFPSRISGFFRCRLAARCLAVVGAPAVATRRARLARTGRLGPGELGLGLGGDCGIGL
jgi:hypothetical protein